MSFRRLTILLIATFVYIITILFCLLFRLPLQKVLLLGMTALFLVIIFINLIILLVKLFANKEDEIVEEKIEIDEKEEFSPLKPPVLEIKEAKGE